MPLIGGIGGILALASAIGSLFGSRGGGGDGGNSQIPASLQSLLPDLQAALNIDNQASLRNMLLTDPELANFLNKTALSNLGIDHNALAGLASGGVPLRRAANNLSFGLLPRWARSVDSQNALLASSPRSRILPDGSYGPFDNTLVTQGQDYRVSDCIAEGGTPVYDENGNYVSCDLSSLPQPPDGGHVGGDDEGPPSGGLP